MFGEREKEGCLNGVGTYMTGTVLQGCMLFKRCQNLPDSTVLQGCRLFKWCQNLPAGHCVAGVQAVSAVSEPTCQELCCRGNSCLSGVRIYMQTLCCRGVGCLSHLGTYLTGKVLQVCRLLKRYRNLPARHCVAWVQAV